MVSRIQGKMAIKLRNLEHPRNDAISVDGLSTKINIIIKEAQRNHCIRARNKVDKLSQSTKNLMKVRRDTKDRYVTNSDAFRHLNRSSSR